MEVAGTCGPSGGCAAEGECVSERSSPAASARLPALSPCPKGGPGVVVVAEWGGQGGSDTPLLWAPACGLSIWSL